jgi:putative drug exporter of the RND superfamily
MTYVGSEQADPVRKGLGEMRLNPESMARASSRHPWRTVVAWVVVAVAAVAVSVVGLGGVLNNDIRFTNKPESVKAQDVIDAKFSSKQAGKSTEYVIVTNPGSVVSDATFRAFVTRLQGALASSHGLLAAPPVTYYNVAQRSPQQAAGLISDADHDPRTPADPATAHGTLIPISITNDDTSTIEDIRSILARQSASGFTVQMAGPATSFADFSKVAEEDARKGESIGIMAALIVLVVVFGAIVAALVPVSMGVLAIAIALGIVTVVGQLVQFNLFVTNMISMIGLAVGIDYSLFIVSRFREERKKGFAKLDAIAAAGATASRAVFFSGMTVVLALLGMFILPTTIFRALASGAIFVTVCSILAAMTLLPAVLALLGDRINWPRLSKRARLDVPHDVQGGFWDRVTRNVMARPVVFLVGSVVILGTLASFTFQLNKGSSTNIATLPDVPVKAAMLTLERDFAGGLTDPIEVVVTGDVQASQTQTAIRTFQADVAELPAFASETVVQPSPDGSAIKISTYLKGDTQNDAAFAAVRQLRSTTVPDAFGNVPGVTVFVGGNTAFFTDFLSVTNTYQWVVLAFVLGLSFVLLTIVFRSIVVPIKAILLNLLSVGAAYGAITLVFQKGVGIGLFNAIGFSFQKTQAIEAWLPLFLFSVLFGLSMDYHVFLLTRIREEYDKTHNNTESVAYGLRTTAGIITGAAIIMVVVFTGFASGRLGPFQQMGFGLAVAVFMDATIVRSLLVPSTMRLLGDLNWYLPSWLQWLPKLNVEGHEPEREVEVIPEAPALVPDGVPAREDA